MLIFISEGACRAIRGAVTSGCASNRASPPGSKREKGFLWSGSPSGMFSG
jgi:hypothetical protein